ncbi:cell pattern formation-associated protein stua [Lichtheimia corymbifera JMRC:FSU:9682]|uniref:Cell pattern formation-associated protein stua n=1 Tax=Lichtheimia corymbifera JMRC:FSU:9682 TaxID=1263082 RepID=A0A068S7E5_9FUNG|nr:cell pattern formation-associated protein stua [Lichtheimia corymbifera JMRC:FSU:9682]
MYSTFAESTHYGNPYSQPQQQSDTSGGQISVMTWNPPPFNRNSVQYSQNPTQQHHHHHHPSYNVPTMPPQQRAHPLPMIPMQRPAMSSPPQQQQRPVMSPQQQQQQHASPSQTQNNSNNSQSQQQQQQQQPKLTTSYWEDEGTICYQVDARGFCVARRQDNDMVNGTKLLNVVGMSRGRRDGILKNERGRVVVKVGAMHLKGVWITISRAKALAAQFNISELLHPLFTDDPSIFFYANPPMLPPMPPGYFFPGTVQFPASAFPPPPPPPPVPPRMTSSETNHSMARAPSVPSMVFNNFAQQQQQYAVPPPPPPPQTTAPPTSAPPPPPPSQASFHFEATSLSDYASRATNGSSSALSESAPPTPCSQQYHHHLHMLHPYDGTSSANTSSTALETPSMDSQLLNQYDVDMFTPSPAAYYDEQAQHHLNPPQYHQQQQEAKWYNYPIQTQQQPLHYHQPW